MANASPADVRAGWEIFRKDPELSLENLQHELEALGRQPVSQRTLQHYRSLLKAGFDRYVSINRFDVARAAQPFEGLSALPRYFYFGVDAPVKVEYERGGKAFEVSGTAERVGEVGAIITVAEDVDVLTLTKERPYLDGFVTLNFPAPAKERATARLIDLVMDDETEQALLEVEFSRLHAMSGLLSAQPLSPDLVTITVQGVRTDDHAADLIGRRIFYTLDALESCRSIVNEVLRTEGPSGSGQRIVDPPQLQRIALENPLVIVLGLPAAVGAVAFFLWRSLHAGEKAAGIYKTVQEGNVEKATAKKIQAETKKVEAETRSIDLDNTVKEAGVDLAVDLFSAARSELADKVKLAKPKLTEADEARRSTLVGEASESMRALKRQEVGELEIKTGS